MRGIRRTAGVSVFFCVLMGTAAAQFSPGELSKAHQHLEGMNNCLQCHETGNEISGRKCLTCHQEIQAGMDARRGYHFSVSAQRCVACHKDHLGRDAQTTLFDKRTFDHTKTGFVRTGKHAQIDCAECHAKKNVRDPLVLKILNATPKTTYLGLSTACIGCHTDKHNNTVSAECKNCHDTKAWAPVTKSFDHGRTKFALNGKHAAVACSKCHQELEHKEPGKALVFSTKPFTDCAPCHASPHSADFVKQACSSCHTAENWKGLKSGTKFNHDLTRFRLVGKHAAVACEKCHSPAAKAAGKSLKLAYNKCTDCHADFHKGDFAGKGDCEKCHTPYGFAPSTFTLAMHGATRFVLRGAHAATPCGKCHTHGTDGRPVFHFAGTRCESCHKDPHGNQFANRMKEQSCDYCHSTDRWSPTSFDHSTTGFVLMGKHARAKCSSCHKPMPNGVVQYRGTAMTCQSCHTDNHAKQFAVNDETNCAPCHSAVSWNQLLFDHEKQSVFTLTGAHKRVECRQCHREERRGEKTFIRYKPISTKCESCHAGGNPGNG